MAGLLPIKVAEDIESRIKSGLLTEGEKLPSEREMAENYSVSRNVVREALKMLNEKGLVDILTGKGAYVTKPKADDLLGKFENALDCSNVNAEELLEARLEMELVIAKKVIANVTDEDIRKMKELFSYMEDSIYNISEYLKLDARFHLFLAQCSNNQVLVLIASTLNNLTDRRSYFSNKGIELIKRAQREHAQMIEAIEKRNYMEFETSIRRHLECIRMNLE